MLTALSPQVLEQCRLLLPADNDAHVDGVCGQHGPQAGLRAGDPAGGGEQPGGQDGALGGWGLTAAPSRMGRCVRSAGFRHPRRLAPHGNPGPWQSCTGDTSGPSRRGKEAEDGPTRVAHSAMFTRSRQTHGRNSRLRLRLEFFMYSFAIFVPVLLKLETIKTAFKNESS